MTATTFCEKMDWIATGKPSQIPISVEAVKPMAIESVIVLIIYHIMNTLR